MWAVQLPNPIPADGSEGGPPAPAARKILFGMPFDVRTVFLDLDRNPEKLHSTMEKMMREFQEQDKERRKKQKQPWFIRRRDGEPMAFAGLWEIWHDPKIGDDAPRIRTFTIITTEPNELLAPIHDRMPVVLPESEWARWLDPSYNDVEALQKLLVPAPNDDFELWPIGTLVNKADNDGPDLREPVEGAA